MEYYYTDGITNYGPYTLDQIKEKNLTAETKVWYSGLSGWTPASELPEFSGMFNTGSQPVNPPPVSQSGNYNTFHGIAPKSWFVEAILVTIFCCQPFGIVAIVYAAMVESAIAAGNFTEAHRVSKLAGKWTKIGFICGLVAGILFIIFYGIILSTALKNVPNLQDI